MNENDWNDLKALFGRFFNNRPQAEREAKISDWLYNASVCRDLDFTGANSAFVLRLIGRLRDYGQVSSNVPALVRALQGLREEVGVDVQGECDRLIDRLQHNQILCLRLIHRPRLTHHVDAIENCHALLITAGIEVERVRCE